MGLFDNLAGMAGKLEGEALGSNLDLAALAGNPEVAALAARVGITPEEVQRVLAALAPAAAQPGDTAENAANAAGVPLDRVTEVLRHLGGGEGWLGELGGLFGPR